MRRVIQKQVIQTVNSNNTKGDKKKVIAKRKVKVKQKR